MGGVICIRPYDVPVAAPILQDDSISIKAFRTLAVAAPPTAVACLSIMAAYWLQLAFAQPTEESPWHKFRPLCKHWTLTPAGFTLIVNIFVTDCFGDDESSALTVKLDVPTVVGVQKIRAREIERPTGNVPEDTDQVYGAVPSVTDKDPE